MGVIYLDNNASTRLCDAAFEAMVPWLRDNWANASSIRHRPGRQARNAVEQSRQTLAGVLNCAQDEIIFTSGATESNAMALMGARFFTGAPPQRILTARTEHMSVLTAALQATNDGDRLEFAQTPENGSVTAADFARLSPGAGDLISLAWVSGETGIINDVEGVAELAARTGALLHIDATQALGRIEVDLRRLPTHFATFSSHKIHGPKGVGLLFARRGTRMEALWLGGSQENRRRGGTENVAGIVGFATAARDVERVGTSARQAMAGLRDRLENDLSRATSECVVIGRQAPRVPNTSMMAWAGVSSRHLLTALDRAGICASAGSACSSATEGVSVALHAMGLPQDTVMGSVRFSLSRDTTAAEIDRAVSVIAREVAALRP